jgi:hypothetical protein
VFLPEFPAFLANPASSRFKKCKTSLAPTLALDPQVPLEKAKTKTLKFTFLELNLPVSKIDAIYTDVPLLPKN